MRGGPDFLESGSPSWHRDHGGQRLLRETPGAKCSAFLEVCADVSWTLQLHGKRNFTVADVEKAEPRRGKGAAKAPPAAEWLGKSSGWRPQSEAAAAVAEDERSRDPRLRPAPAPAAEEALSRRLQTSLPGSARSRAIKRRP